MFDLEAWPLVPVRTIYEVHFSVVVQITCRGTLGIVNVRYLLSPKRVEGPLVGRRESEI